ncbi:immunity 22 family protein [Comamonas serinivorans]|nr:immunity 22 family protein [Comamonas serinivorans]
MLDDRVPHSLAIWMGLTTQSPASFRQYFDGMDELAAFGAIQRDLGTNFIDPDWFYWDFHAQPQPVASFVQELDCQPETQALVLKAARAKGLTEVNAFFCHVEARFHEAEPERRYNDLLFLGNFPD